MPRSPLHPAAPRTLPFWVPCALLCAAAALLPRGAAGQAFPAPGFGDGTNRPAAPAGQAAPQAPPAEPPEIVTRQDRFTIPFTVNDTADPQRQPVEVQLHVTSDGGITWTLLDRQPPNAANFAFHSQGDGRYGFAIRTIDRLGRSWPEGPLRPELRVRVDTAPPTFELRVEGSPSGALEAQWEARDMELEPATLKLELRTAPGDTWRPLALRPDQSSAGPGVLLGSGSWWVQAPGSVVEVRGEVRDRAGNLAVVNRRVSLAAGPGSTPAAGAERLPPVAGGGTPTRNTSTRVDPFERYGGVPLPEGSVPPAESGAGGERFIPESSASPVEQQAPRPERFTSGGAGTGEGAEPAGPRFEIPPGIEPTMIRSRRFNLQYDIDSLGPDGVAKVELWVTQNGGASWRSWGIDPDKQSPLTMETPQDGLYGVRIVVTAASGFAGEAPRAGDEADFWVGVDTEPPVVEITSVPFGDGPNLGKLDIRWSAADVRLAERPITLLFRRDAQESWVTLAAGLPNSGRYLWSVDPSLVGKLYLKIQARDAAGNIGEHELPQPINLAGLAPQGRVRGVLPAE